MGSDEHVEETNIWRTSADVVDIRNEEHEATIHYAEYMAIAVDEMSIRKERQQQEA